MLSFRCSGLPRSHLVATGSQHICSARSFDLAGKSHATSLADIKAAMKGCAVLPYMPQTTRFEGKTAMLEGLYKELHPSCEREADLEREGLRLTLLAQGLTSPVPRDTRRLATEKRARFVLCNAQTLHGVKWTKAQSCRCGLAGEASKSLSKRLRAKGCSLQPQLGTVLKSDGVRQSTCAMPAVPASVVANVAKRRCQGLQRPRLPAAAARALPM